MSKALPATCQGGVVTCEGKPVAGVVILSEGVGPSSGTLFLEEDKAYYVAKTSPDLKDALASISNALANTSAALTAIDNVGFWSGGGAPTPPFLGTVISGIDTAKASLDTLRGAMK